MQAVESGLPVTLRELRLSWELTGVGFLPSNPPPRSLAWVSRFTALRTLCVRPFSKFCVGLPPDFAGMASLRDLELEGSLATKSQKYTDAWRHMHSDTFAARICGLTGLTRLALREVKLGGEAELLEEWNAEDPEDDMLHSELFFPLTEAITRLQALRSLTITQHAMSCALLVVLLAFF